MPGLVLFSRFPSLRWRPQTHTQIVPLAAQSEFPEFLEDFATLERELLPHFRTLDNDALSRQNQFRLEQLLLIFGGMLAAILGALQTALSGAAWPGIAETILAAALTAVAFRQRELRARDRYSASRLKAEALRREYFLFIGRLRPYEQESERVRQLIQRIGQILTDQAGKRA